MQTIATLSGTQEGMSLVGVQFLPRGLSSCGGSAASTLSALARRQGPILPCPSFTGAPLGGAVHLLPFELERDTPVSGALGPKALATQPARHTQDIRSKRLTAAIKWHFYTCLNWSEDENLETM